MEKTKILYTHYPYRHMHGTDELYMFWPMGMWDDNKYFLEEALIAYPKDKYEWVYTDE